MTVFMHAVEYIKQSYNSCDSCGITEDYVNTIGAIAKASKGI